MTQEEIQKNALARPPDGAFKVALVNPPFLKGYSRSQRSPGVIRSGTLYYPYWLAHAAAVLEKEDFFIHLFDFPAASLNWEQAQAQVKAFSPDLVVIETSTASSQNDCEWAESIKQLCPQAQVCMVGTHATALWREVLEGYPLIDFVAIGEYDFIVLELAQALRLTRASKAGCFDSLKKIPGLALRDLQFERKSGIESGIEDGIVRGPIRPPIENMDSLPWVSKIYQRFLDPRNYYFSLAHYPMLMLIGGRGCVAKCTYCVYPQVMHGHHYRTRTAASIAAEMKWIQENMPEIREIVFEDDTFTGDREFAREVAERIRQEGITLPWFANIRANVDKETLVYLKQAGLRCCAVGFESADNTLLKNMLKGQTVETQKRFVQTCRELGILVHGCFMVGFPGETQATMKKTLDLALEILPDSAQFYPVMPFPGTAYYDWAKTNGFLVDRDFRNWVDNEGRHRCVLNLPGLSAEEIEGFCSHAYFKFYFRPKYMVQKLKQALQSPTEGVRSIQSFCYYLLYLVFKRKKSRALAPKPEWSGQWYTVHKMPLGRMYRQEIALKEAQNDAGELEALAKTAPDL